MCGRFTTTDPNRALRELFGRNEPPLDLIPRYNVAPTQTVAAVRLNDRGGRGLAKLRWGLIPAWAKEAAIGAKMINARAETVTEKPAFRAAFQSRRCLIPADGFYEWQADGKSKQPYRIVLGAPDRPRPFAFAALWERWRDPARPEAPPLDTFTIVTTAAAAAIAPIHHRMPVMLTRREELETWLDAARPARDALAVLKPYDGADIAAVPVSLKVNNARYDAPDCATPGEAVPPTIDA